MFIVFDLDGTIANCDHREHILEEEHENESAKWHAFFDACDGDTPYTAMCVLFDSLASEGLPEGLKHRIQIWTGRSERVRGKTIQWLNLHLRNFRYIDPYVYSQADDNLRNTRHHVAMRGETDYRHDLEVKGEWIKWGKPDLVFDDRRSMVEWWREQGVTCAQVKDSDF